ncbi:MAG: HD domain-containing phosphohydrolase [Campylobacterota bacterium]|nr:HD domain-containing phosphohydrolase [Campylobacterota bacterium]
MLHKIGMYQEMAEIIIYHHERYDGKGYPEGLKENEIPPLARIMIVADAFDAMTTNRIYKGRKEASVAIAELKELSGKQFHPEVIEAAVEVLSDIEIIDSISQLPVTEIEQERFSYFYRDQVTHAYNMDYLNFILNRNYFEQEYICINALYMHNFSNFNAKHGWSGGDKLLSQFVDYLQDLYPLSMIFRFHGDDFILISKEHLEIDMNQFESLDMFKKEHISISKLHIDLRENKIRDLKELEELL